MILLAARLAHRLAWSLTVLASLLLVWLAMGVGLIGADGDPANRVYAAVLGLGGLGTLLARARPAGMARTLLAMAALQLAIAVWAVLTGQGHPYSPPAELIGVNGLFMALFLLAAGLFRRAARAAHDRSPP